MSDLSVRSVLPSGDCGPSAQLKGAGFDEKNSVGKGMVQGILLAEGGKFLELIKSSVLEGFGVDREIVGEMPGATSRLVDWTYDLVISKLDDWAIGQGISTEKQS